MILFVWLLCLTFFKDAKGKEFKMIIPRLPEVDFFQAPTVGSDLDMNFKEMVEYDSSKTAHKITSTLQGTISFRFESRGVQHALLCLNQGGPCEANYDVTTKTLIVTGEAADIEAAENYDSFLSIDKPSGDN